MKVEVFRSGCSNVGSDLRSFSGGGGTNIDCALDRSVSVSSNMQTIRLTELSGQTTEGYLRLPGRELRVAQTGRHYTYTYTDTDKTKVGRILTNLADVV